MAKYAARPATKRELTKIGQGVPLINMASHTLSSWHMRAILATFILRSDKTLASLLLLQFSSWRYAPVDRPSPKDCTPPLVDIRQESMPLDIKLGEIAEPTGIEPGEEPAPL